MMKINAKWLLALPVILGAYFMFLSNDNRAPSRVAGNRGYDEGSLVASANDSPPNANCEDFHDNDNGQGKGKGHQRHECRIPMPIYPSRNLQPNQANGEWVLVTGVSRGNGRATAERFRELGYRVIGTYREPVGQEELYKWPKFKPGKKPNVDREVYFDVGDANDPVKIAAFLNEISSILGGDKLSVIVPAGLQFFLGTEQGTYLAGNLPARDQALFNIGDGQFYLIRELLNSGNVAPNVRVIPIVSVISWTRYSPVVSAYAQAKTGLKSVLDCYSAELETIPGLNTAFPNLRITKVHPVLVNTGGLDSFAGYSRVGPVFGHPFSVEGFVALEKTAGSAQPSDVANAIVEAAQHTEPPTDVYVLPPKGRLARSAWRNYLQLQHCGDPDGEFDALYHEEFTQDGIRSSYDKASLNAQFDFPVVALLDPINFETLGVTGTGPARKFVFSGLNLDGANMKWEVKINNNPWTVVNTTYVPAFPPFVEKWVQNDAVDFSSYAGQTVHIQIRGTTPNVRYKDDVSALNTYALQINVPSS